MKHLIVPLALVARLHRLSTDPTSHKRKSPLVIRMNVLKGDKRARP